MDETQNNASSNSPLPAPREGGVGAKIAIIVIILIIILGGLYFWFNRTDSESDASMNQEESAQNQTLGDDDTALENELNAGSEANIEGDLRGLDNEFE